MCVEERFKKKKKLLILELTPLSCPLRPRVDVQCETRQIHFHRIDERPSRTVRDTERTQQENASQSRH